MSTKKITTILFDLYGTLVYSTVNNKAYQKLFNELNLNKKEKKEIRNIVLKEDFLDLKKFIKRIAPNYTINLKHYQKDILEEVSKIQLFPETIPVLKELQNRNITLGLISNLGSAFKKPFFDLKLDNYFNTITFSCEIGYIKPEPQIYKLTLQALNKLPSETIMIGDKILPDIKGPEHVGIKGILINRTNTIKHESEIKSLEEIYQYL